MVGVPFVLLSVLANAALPSQALSLLSRSAKKVDDCGMPNTLRMTASLLQSEHEHGPHDEDNKVLKSGFMQLTCIKDYMYYHGDKFGAGRHSYELGRVGVSIVHYDSMVKKEDREPMSQKVCFKFCRSVPNMNFFGLLNGRKCYCEPYYKAMAGDSSMCDANCDGDKTKFCGGKSKSTIFSMHSCQKKDKPKKANDGKCKKCCWKKNTHCEGGTIGDFALSKNDCKNRCKFNKKCGCVTWGMDKKKPCRMETGTSVHKVDDHCTYEGLLIKGC